MKVLIDECLPRALKRLLVEHDCQTVREMGWSGKKNGELLALAEKQFDVLITIDQAMPGQVTADSFSVLVNALGLTWAQPVQAKFVIDEE